MSRIFLLLACLVVACAQTLNIPAPPVDSAAIFSNNEWITLKELTYNSAKPTAPQVPEEFVREATIFVTIQHYRDARCATTIDHLLKHAKYSDRVRIGNIHWFLQTF
jgi:hypothetical protein